MKSHKLKNLVLLTEKKNTRSTVYAKSRLRCVNTLIDEKKADLEYDASQVTKGRVHVDEHVNERKYNCASQVVCVRIYLLLSDDDREREREREREKKRKSETSVKSVNEGSIFLSENSRYKKYIILSSTVGSEAWNSRDLKSRPH